MPQATTASRTRRRAAGGFLLGISVGVLIGLAVALGVAFYLNKTPMPFLTAKPTKSDKDLAAGKPPVIAGLPQGSSAPPPAGEKPKFDFYKILPGQEEPVTEKELRERSRTARGQQEGSKDVYFIQAGAVLEPGRCRQSEGEARDSRLRVERRAGQPARQGHVVPGAPRPL